MQNCTKSRQTLLALLERHLALKRPDAGACQSLRTKLQEGHLQVAVLGEFKRGKSSLLNALLGDNLLPVGVIPLTSLAITLSYGLEEGILVRFLDGSTLAVDRSGLAAYATESGNPHNIHKVEEIRVIFPSPLLQDGIHLLDTPGIGSVHSMNSMTARSILPRCDAVLFVLCADQVLSEAELAYLEEAKAYAHSFFFILNKIDYLNPAELQQSLDFLQTHLTAVMGGHVRLYPLSARLAIKGMMEHDATMLAASGIEVFRTELLTFLGEHKVRVLLNSVINTYRRLLNQTYLEIKLEQQAAGIDLPQLDDRIRQFEARKARALGEKKNLYVFVRTEIKRIVQEVLDTSIKECQQDLARELPTQLNTHAETLMAVPMRVFDQELERFSEQCLKMAFASWQREVERCITPEWQNLCKRTAGQMAGLADDLQEYASELMELAIVPQSASPDTLPDHCRYRPFQRELLGLEIISRASVLDWPDKLPNRFHWLKSRVLNWARRATLKRHQNTLEEAIDCHCGRLRYEFLTRLEHAAQDLAEAEWMRIDTVASGLSQALSQGRSRLLLEADIAAQYRQQLEHQVAEIESFTKILVTTHPSQQQCVRSERD